MTFAVMADRYQYKCDCPRIPSWFSVASTQMRDSTGIHLKLDDLLRAETDARSNLVSLEKLPDAKFAELMRGV